MSVPTITSYGQRLADRVRGLPPMAVDVAITLGCWLYVVIRGVVDNELTWWSVLLATAATMPLLWRRRYPFGVTVAAGIGTTWLALADLVGDIPVAQLVATYTFAALCPPAKRVLAAAGTAIGGTVSILVPDEDVLNLAVAGIMFVMAYALGTSARARRDRIAMLEERALRLGQEQQAAATRERQRIAREMHDILAHTMSLVVVQAEAGPVAVRSDPGKAEEMFDTISATAREALAQLRRTLGVLRADEPAREPQPGLDSLPALVEGVRNAGVAATLEQDGEPRPVPADLAATVYRIVQESLTNTVKHAAAGSVRVRLGWGEHVLRLEVSDDGRGPGTVGPAGSDGSRTNGNDTGGHGLIGMRERVAAAGGELAFGPGPGGTGFRVAASLPLQ